MSGLAKEHAVAPSVCKKVETGKVPFKPDSLRRKLEHWASQGYPKLNTIERKYELDGLHGERGETYRWKLGKKYHAVLKIHEDIAVVVWLGSLPDYLAAYWDK